MDYISNGHSGVPNFDCDDFAYAFYRWATRHGYVCWQIGGTWRDSASNDTFGHQFNIIVVARPSGGDISSVYLAYFEPQPSIITAVWKQTFWGSRLLLRPRPTPQAITTLEKYWGMVPRTLNLDRRANGLLSGGGEHHEYAGEPVFTNDPRLVNRFEKATKVKIKGWR